MPQATFSVVLAAAVFGQPSTIDADGFPKSVQTETICATVRIANAEKKMVGTGIFLGKSGRSAYILTAAHVVAGTDSVEVHVFSKDDFDRPRVYRTVQVVARRRENGQDLALLRIPEYTFDLKTIALCPTAELPKEKSISAFAVGCADFKPPRLRAESIRAVQAAKPGETAPVKLWQSAQKSLGGESGGPLVNGRGQLLGICSGSQGPHAYYCHLEDIRAFLRSSGLSWVLEKKR